MIYLLTHCILHGISTALTDILTHTMRLHDLADVFFNCYTYSHTASLMIYTLFLNYIIAHTLLWHDMQLKYACYTYCTTDLFNNAIHTCVYNDIRTRKLLTHIYIIRFTHYILTTQLLLNSYTHCCYTAILTHTLRYTWYAHRLHMLYGLHNCANATIHTAVTLLYLPHTALTMLYNRVNTLYTYYTTVTQRYNDWLFKCYTYSHTAFNWYIITLV